VSDTVLLPEIGIEDSDIRACRVVAEDSLAFAKSDSVRVGRDETAKSDYWFARAGSLYAYVHDSERNASTDMDLRTGFPSLM
jgi:hypothetical protein